MKRIMALAFLLVFSALATAHAVPDYATNAFPTPPPGVTCSTSGCHSDGRTWYMFHNLYDSSSNSVHLPVINVGGTYYSADLVLIQTSPAFRFRVDNIQASQALPSVSFPSVDYDSARVTFNAVSSQLVIQNITVGTQNYQGITLTLVPGVPDIEFQL